MVRAFGRKSDSGSRFSVGEESGWFDGTSSNETSPGSLWGLNDDTHFRNENGNENGNEDAIVESSDQDVPTEQAYSEDPSFSPEEADWWSQPNLMEQSYAHSIQERTPEWTPSDHSYELTDEERPIDTLELPVLVLPTPNFEDYDSHETRSEHRTFASDDDADETTLVTNVPSFSSEPEDEAVTIASAKEEKAEEIKPRPRVLNEASVLPHEASFATVSLYQRSPRSYSPGKEFVTKIVSGVQRSLPVLLLVAVCGALIFFSLKYKSTLFDSPNEEQTHRTSAPVTTSEPAATPAGTTTAPVATLRESDRAPAAVEPVRPPVESKAPAKTEVATPKTAAEKKPATAAEKKPATAAEKKPATAAEKKPVAISKAASAKPQPSEPRRRAAVNSTAKPKPQSNTKVETPKTAPKPAAEAPAAPTGGGERPRRVNAQASASATPKT
jgi:hypothetical protein